MFLLHQLFKTRWVFQTWFNVLPQANSRLLRWNWSTFSSNSLNWIPDSWRKSFFTSWTFSVKGKMQTKLETDVILFLNTVVLCCFCTSLWHQTIVVRYMPYKLCLLPLYSQSFTLSIIKAKMQLVLYVKVFHNLTLQVKTAMLCLAIMILHLPVVCPGSATCPSSILTPRPGWRWSGSPCACQWPGQ